MGKMKEDFMQMREQMQSQEINTLTDIAQEYHNNNQSKLEMKNLENSLKNMGKNLGGSFDKWRTGLGKELSFTNTKRAMLTLLKNIKETVGNIDEKELQEKLINLEKEIKNVLTKKPFKNDNS